MTFGASENTYVYAREYLLIYAAGAIFSITAVGLNQFIIAQGYAGVGMMTTIIGAVANVALDPLFIFAFRMNVAGAALATVLSQFLSFLFVGLTALRRRVGRYVDHRVYRRGGVFLARFKSPDGNFHGYAARSQL